MPEAAGSPGSDEPAPAKSIPSSAAGEYPRRRGVGLVRVELELPDGRYLLSYRELEEAGEGDA